MRGGKEARIADRRLRERWMNDFERPGVDSRKRWMKDFEMPGVDSRKRWMKDFEVPPLREVGSRISREYVLECGGREK